MVRTFKHAPLMHPVIVTIDNDDGAKGVFGALKNQKIVIGHNTSADFYHVTRNLYVVKTPEGAAAPFTSQIEDFFDAQTLGVKLNGKTFNKKNDADTSTEYGKSYFADHVVAPKAKSINFLGFTPLLNRIVAAIAQHQTNVAGGVV